MSDTVFVMVQDGMANGRPYGYVIGVFSSKDEVDKILNTISNNDYYKRLLTPSIVEVELNKYYPLTCIEYDEFGRPESFANDNLVIDGGII